MNYCIMSYVPKIVHWTPAENRKYCIDQSLSVPQKLDTV